MKTILVVGAAGGVGSAVAAGLAARGERVLGTVLNDAEATAARAQVPQIASLDIVDMADPDRVAASVRAIVARAGSLDAVVVCAAISPLGPVETTPLALVRRTFEINTLSGVAIYQAVLPTLRKSQGRIVFISSMAGRSAMPFIGAYTASKYALEGIADVMRREASPQGVHIALVEPGGIRTGMVANQLKSNAVEMQSLTGEARQHYLYLYEGFQRLAQQSHDQGSSTPEAVAAVVLEALDAAKPAARYIAGEDAKALLAMEDKLPAAEMDGVYAQMFSPQAA